MRILHLTNKMDPKTGGVCQAVRATIKGLIEMNTANEVVSFDDAGSVFLRNDSFSVYALGNGRGPWSYNHKLVPWLFENVTRYNVVVLHGLWQYNGYALNKVVKRLKREGNPDAIPKIFVMPHGMLDPYFQVSSGRKIKAIRNWIYWKLIEGKVVNDADGLLFTCEEERRLAQVTFRPYSPQRESVVGLGVETPPAFSWGMHDEFVESCPSVNDQPYLLFLSRIHEKKGVDLLIDSYGKVVKERFSLGQETPKLVIAGPGLDSKFGQTMQQSVIAKNLEDSIFFPGMLTGKAKWGAFYGCDAFVLPSHQENFGIAVVEALACGRPVLISDQVNIWCEIQEEGGGIVAEDNLKGTFNLLVTWLNLSEEKKEAMRNNARFCFDKNFTVSPSSKRFYKALN